MSSMVLESGLYFQEEDDRGPEGIDFLEDSARSVELVREEGKDGQLGSFGFIIEQEKPPRIRSVVPGGPAVRAGLKRGDIILAVNGQDITKLSHKQVTALIRDTTELRVWLSVCESENYLSSADSSFSSSPQKGSYIYASTPIINTDLGDSPIKKSHNLLNNSLGSQLRPFNGSAMIPVPQYGSLPKVGGFSPLGRKVMTQNEAAYVTFVPPSTYTVTRLSTVLNYCGPVKIPESWSNRGVSSLCIQECARQLLSKRKTEDFIKVQFEVSQRSLKITNTSGVVLAKHLRQELYYCGLCSSDEHYFAIVTRRSSEIVGQAQADLCHVFKLMSDSKLSTYCINRAKSEREMRSGQPSSLNSCLDIIDAIQNIFQSETHNPTASLKRGVEATDGVDYGVIRGIPTLQISGSGGSTDSLGSSPLQASPLLRRKKSNVVDLRVKEALSHNRQRSVSIPINPPIEYTISPIATTSSAGYIRPQANNEVVHIRVGSDGSNSSNSSTRSRPLPTLRGHHPPEDKAKRVSDSSLSSMSSDHSGHRSGSQSPTPKNTSGSMTPVHNPYSHRQHIALGRKQSQPTRTVAVSPVHNGSRPHQLRRQGSDSSLGDLPALSPYHHYGLPAKNGALSSSVDSIVTITTLAEDDVDAVVGRVAGWCGSFDKLLADPLGIQCLQQFLEIQHGEENILFWRDVEDFKTKKMPNLQEAAKHIYEEYLSLAAPHTINIDDGTLKSIEANISNPTQQLFNEAQKEIYQLMKLDCYPRFKKSQVIKDCLCAEMEGKPLPVSLLPTSSSSNVTSTVHKVTGPDYGKKKTGHSLFSRIKGLQHKSSTTSSLLSRPPPIEHPLTQSVDSKKTSKKERKDSTKKHRSKSSDNVGYHPEENLKQLQAHKNNLFEVSLPNRVTKIIEAPPQTTVGESIANVLKKYNYSLDIMEIKLTNTLQPVDINAPAATLIGKHVSITRSKHTVIVTFPDIPEITLPVDGTTTIRQLLDKTMMERGKVDSYSVYLEGARAPLELNTTTSNLEGHTVAIKYNPASTPPSKTASTPVHNPIFNLASESGSSIGSSSSKSSKISDGVEELFSMIARLNADTLQDQRILSPEDELSRKNLPKTGKKGKKTPSPKPSPKFTRTKSGAAISEKHMSDTTQQQRSLSPPPTLTKSLPPRRYPPPPSSDPPNLSSSTLNRPYDSWEHTGYPRHFHSHQRSADAMSGVSGFSGVSNGSGSSVDSITHELAVDRRVASRNQLFDWVNHQADMSGTPYYFPSAFGSRTTLNKSQGDGFNSRTSSLTRASAAAMNPYKANSDHPLDNLVSEAYHQKQVSWPIAEYGTEHGISSSHLGVPSSSYPWRYVHGNPPKPKPGPGSGVSVDSQQLSDSESLASSGPHTNHVKPPLSPTTHVLVVDEQSHSETFV